jgi:hypothetical protein
MQILGLSWAEADKETVRGMAGRLIAEQHSDGGWGQLQGLESDAYATGQALVALKQVRLTETAAAYQHGADFLLRTQTGDGSWHVHTRTYPFQPYKESGFPYGKDQWISAAGTAWATMALTLAEPPQQELSLLQ